MPYRPQFFILQELVPPGVFDRLGEAAWDLFDTNALQALDKLRQQFGPITVNNWHRGGAFKESGLREANTATGAPKSAHKLGKAFDCKPGQTTVKAMYDYILDNQNEFQEIRRMEDLSFTPTWLHFDTVEHPGTRIRVFKP